MCGIAGYVTLDPARVTDRALVRAMTSTLEHRGPDDEGYHVAPGVALGMRRLRVIDLVGGAQPIANEDGSVWIVFNGEIYNYRELRKRLDGRHRFATASDTEVIVHLYEDEGVECVRSLRGMFAFALWDVRDRSLLLARDHVGEKPLYYAQCDGAVWFGSEIKALLAVPSIGRSLDATALDDYLALGYVPAPKSIFESIRKLPPGSSLRVHGGAVSQSRYWRPELTPRASVTVEHAVAGLGTRLERAVEQRSIADVPLGAFLSGGIDSTTVVMLLSAQSSLPVKTFSIGFDHPDYDELPYARAVARAFHTEHYEEVAKPDALALLPELVKYFDEPFGDSSAIPTYLVARLARQHVTVALSGDGGDEAFAGYDRYRKAYLLTRIRRMLAGRYGAAALGRAAAWWPGDTAWRRRLIAVLGRAARPAIERYFEMVGLSSPELRREVLARSWTEKTAAVPASFSLAWRETGALDETRQLQAVDIATYLPDDILVKVDRATMAVSLEARAPLLDPDLIEYVASLPTALSFGGRQGKVLLRRFLAGRVPEEVLSRPKRGFAVPLRHWFREGWKESAREILLDGALTPYFRRAAVERMLSEHASGAADHGEHLWLLLVFAAWRQRYLGGR